MNLNTHILTVGCIKISIIVFSSNQENDAIHMVPSCTNKSLEKIENYGTWDLPKGYRLT